MHLLFAEMTAMPLRHLQHGLPIAGVFA